MLDGLGRILQCWTDWANYCSAGSICLGKELVGTWGNIHHTFSLHTGLELLQLDQHLSVPGEVEPTSPPKLGHILLVKNWFSTMKPTFLSLA